MRCTLNIPILKSKNKNKMEEENRLKMYGFRLTPLEQKIYDNYLIDNNLSSTKQLINRLVLNTVTQTALNNLKAKKQLK